MESDQHFSKFHGDAPARSAEIERFEASASFKLPKDYGRFLKRWNGGEGFIGPNAYVILWKLEELMELNKAYQVADYAPGLFVFGSDGGGEAYAFDVRTPAMPIVSVPFVGLDWSLARAIAPTFSGFLDVLSKE